MEKLNIMGIDPGKGGGWALTRLKHGTISVGKMPLTAEQIDVAPLALLLAEMGEPHETIVIVEKVHSMPKQGVASTFTFGVGYGKVIGMCQTLGISFDLVPPQSWKSTILQNTKKDKAAAIDYVKRLFPRVPLIPEGAKKPHDGIADAVCIMQWGVEKYGTC